MRSGNHLPCRGTEELPERPVPMAYNKKDVRILPINKIHVKLSVELATGLAKGKAVTAKWISRQLP